MNKNGSKYDGVIFKNVYDYGSYSGENEQIPNDVYVTFNSNQFKAVDNTKPTSDADIRYSLSENTISEKTQRAIDTMGTTTNMKVAGYLTVDGQFIDFSGKHQGAIGDQRQMDHREIADVYTDDEYDNAEEK